MDTRRQFQVLWRAFFAQFFTSETVTSDVHLHQAIAWVLAFLLATDLRVLSSGPSYHLAVILAARFHAPGRIDDALESRALALVTFSMVTVGLVATFVWDALAFDRRDAMVLGPLPLRGATVVLAKLAALALFLLVVSTGVNGLNAFVFALETGDGLGSFGVVRRFIAILAPTIAGAAFVFSAIALLRGAVALTGRPRLNTTLGFLTQFAAVTAVLLVVVLPPAVGAAGAPRPGALQAGAAVTPWMPPSWFLGLFERLRGSPRHAIVALGTRALVATPLAIAAAIIVLVAGYRRQMQLALTPAASAGQLGRARVGRLLARVATARDAVARATADFILLTLSRSRAHRPPIAINSAIGATLAAAGLASRVRNLSSVTTPRTATLWIPLLFAYWIAVGVRASFFVPAELPSAWLFNLSAPERRRSYWSAARASAFAVVAPPALGLTAILAAFVGWRVAAWHAVIVLAMSALLAEIVALTIDFIPFTRPYRPGHAQLRTRWWIYAIGIYVFAYGPARWELHALGSRAGLVGLTGLLAVAIAALEIAGRLLAPRWTVQSRDEEDDETPHISVLALGGAVERA